MLRWAEDSGGCTLDLGWPGPQNILITTANTRRNAPITWIRKFLAQRSLYRRRSVALKMFKNAFTGVHQPRTPLEELTTLPRTQCGLWWGHPSIYPAPLGAFGVRQSVLGSWCLNPGGGGRPLQIFSSRTAPGWRSAVYVQYIAFLLTERIVVYSLGLKWYCRLFAGRCRNWRWRWGWRRRSWRRTTHRWRRTTRSSWRWRTACTSSGKTVRQYRLPCTMIQPIVIVTLVASHSGQNVGLWPANFPWPGMRRIAGQVTTLYR